MQANVPALIMSMLPLGFAESARSPYFSPISGGIQFAALGVRRRWQAAGGRVEQEEGLGTGTFLRRGGDQPLRASGHI